VDGPLGDGTEDGHNSPVDVIGLGSGVIAVTAGWNHTCAIISGGGVKCWGSNMSGQLGDGTTEERHIPADVVGLASGVVAIAAGGEHTCALTSGGALKCWGGNYNGQLGDGSSNIHHTPVEISGFASHATAIATGSAYACALAGAGRVKCWGIDDYGQLGLGMQSWRSTPGYVVESSVSLNLSYPNGQTGSIFTLIGWNFPPDTQATLSINNQIITTTLAVNPTGSFIFFLDASLADPSGYAVTVSVAPGDGISTDSPIANASTGFILSGYAPLRPQEGGGLTFRVPAGIAYPIFVTHLPMVNR
jgi:Regulator of chromosome condensation (RCC1) repeat